MTAPSVDMLAQLMTTGCARADVKPEDVDFVEMHGKINSELAYAMVNACRSCKIQDNVSRDLHGNARAIARVIQPSAVMGKARGYHF